LAGIGDLIVTATSMHSRNNRCGVLLGQGMPVEEAVREVGMVVEGLNALPAAMQLAERYGVDMPIVKGVNAVVRGDMSPAEMGRALMMRDKTPEVNQSEMNVRFESALMRRRRDAEHRRVLVAGTFPMLAYDEIGWLKQVLPGNKGIERPDSGKGIPLSKFHPHPRPPSLPKRLRN
ncbi:MAG: hypothetical protein E7028_08285, partial [Planctomycetaceae bacterium]|nr:hypothetical protein [Planctomycetaceae bacterium]